MNHPVLSATPRTDMTKGELRAARGAGKIPAVVYGGGQAATAIFLDAKEFQKAVAGISESSIITIDIAGTKKEAFVKERQRGFPGNAIIHVDFIEVLKDRAIHAKVPLHFVGTAVGVREGGILENPAHEIEVECLPGVLPEHIEVDVGELHVNHSIHVRDLKVAAGVKVLSSPDLVVAAVKYAKGEAAAEAAPAAAAPAAAAAAAPAAAPAAEKKDAKK